jgi:1-acyl-sn-glycerol-3-phosphate acyltransferase
MDVSNRHTARENDWFQNIPKALFIQFYRFLIKLKINSIAHLLNHKALIIAIYHKTGVDPIAVQAVLKRRIFFATDGLWFNNWFGRLFFGKLCDGIPVYNGQGVENLPGMRRCLELLHKGFTIGFFPEGTLVRDKPIGEIRDGAAYLSIKSGAPIIPVYIHAPIMGPYPGDVVGSASILEGIISVFGNLFH